MKINGRNLKRRLYGLAMLPKQLSRVRHFRGHGVHSPFVYRLVRQAFMKRKLLTNDPRLYEALRQLGVGSRRATQLQNLYTVCSYQNFLINRLDASCDLCLLTESIDDKRTRAMVVDAVQHHTTVALLSPYAGRERTTLCHQLIEEHTCTSVDHRGYVLLFTHENLPKQHYRL